jgi:hypothetical protein
MRLSDLTIESIKEFISGDNQLTPGLSGPNILKLFNKIGFKDVYKWNDGGMPNSLSRNDYVIEKLYEINGTKELIKLLEIVFDPRHFANDQSKDINIAIKKINPLLQQDGYRLDEIEGKFKVIGSDLPDEVEIDIHFEEIQALLIEQIRNAKFSIWIAVAWFTDKVLMRELYNKAKEGVNIRLVVLDDEINTKYGFEYEKHFETKRAKPTGLFKNIMHHKFCVIDLKTVVHGSYNWTNKARWNKETVSIDVSRELAEKFAVEFIGLIK